MTRPAIELEFWKRLAALESEKASLLKQTADLEDRMAEACARRIEANEEAESLAKQINAIIHPRMGVLMKEVAMLRTALHGKQPPESEG